MSRLAGVVAFIWSISVVRVAVAYEDDERASLEPALAALLSAAPPIALLWRSFRDACFSDATDTPSELADLADDPPGAG